jgi:ABC-2 type transport system permease protein
MNLILRELKANRKSLIIWCIGVFFMVASGMGKYAGLSKSDQSMSDLMADLPKSLQAIIGTGTFDLSKASGYYGILFLYLVLMATIHAAMLGANIIAKEERDKTSEFLYVKPISRTSVISFKLVAALINILIFNIVTFIASVVLVDKYGKGEKFTDDMIALSIGLFMLQLIFLSIGTAIASIIKNSKSSTALTTGILLGTFILSIIIDINENIEGLKYFTPFKYFEAKNIMYGRGLDGIFITISAGIIIVLITSTYMFYKKRDLNT